MQFVLEVVHFYANTAATFRNTTCKPRIRNLKTKIWIRGVTLLEL